MLVHALLAYVAGILKERKRVRQKEGNIHLSSSLPSRVLYPATRAFCIQLLTLFGYSRALNLLGRPLSNRAPQSSLFAIAKQMCVNPDSCDFVGKLQIQKQQGIKNITHNENSTNQTSLLLSSVYRQN